MAQETFNLLAKVVSETTCFKDWSFKLVDEEGAKRLVITINTVSNYNEKQLFRINHYQPVPVAAYNEKTWQRWIFEQCMRVMTHEMGEALKFNGKRPFAPCHGPGFDPYHLHDNVTDEERLIMQDGSVRKPKKRRKDD